MSGSEEEIAAWDRTAAAEGTNRTAWLRALANAAAALFTSRGPVEPTAEPDRLAAWREARHADVNAVALSLPPNASAGQIANALAKRSGFSGWRVTLDGTEFEAKPPPLPKDWKP